jgi:hypothetical protein
MLCAIAGRALCIGDLDNDGRIDLVISDIEGQPLILRNISPQRNHWLRVRLAGTTVTEGAWVIARSGPKQWLRRSTSGGSYLSANDPRVTFGLGQVSEVEQLEVRWPGGKQTVVKVGQIDRELVIQPEGP